MRFSPPRRRVHNSLIHRRNAEGAEQIMPRDLRSHEPQPSTLVILTDDAPDKSASEWKDLASAPIEATASGNFRPRHCHLKQCNERLHCVNLTVAQPQGAFDSAGPSRKAGSTGWAQHDKNVGVAKNKRISP